MILNANAMNVNENKQPIVMKNDILICWEKMSSTRELRKDQLTDFIPIMLLYVCPLKLHSKWYDNFKIFFASLYKLAQEFVDKAIGTYQVLSFRHFNIVLLQTKY